ncbi:DUF983 domain-containing protein [Hyphococcus flavus]|uniref:DUF983 domain-containing protein n=1 Tax=Hyphococcus flavus TaxID=1866326 RepID=A0AAE9ZDP3_9PROT|nr:DUF983 domain-containing protein [Hyphococcus flavus]WDI33099.1 DUF983 domain-containing protein [Hyphococcus flavus]
MTYYPPVSPYAAGLGAKCPRCGQGALYDGFLKLKPVCDACGLDYSKADSGDGPAVFVIFIVGFVAVALAFIVRFVWGAPIGVALLLGGGFTVVAIMALLRPLKATLIALQYANKAAEGRLEE